MKDLHAHINRPFPITLSVALLAFALPWLAGCGGDDEAAVGGADATLSDGTSDGGGNVDVDVGPDAADSNAAETSDAGVEEDSASASDAAEDTTAGLVCPGAPGCPCSSNDECDDSDPCTVDGECDAGACQGKTPVVCDDGVDCTSDNCDPADGCAYPPRLGSCQDGDPCTVGDTCEAGKCKSGAPAVCDDENECTDDSCTPGIGCTFAHNTNVCIAENECSEPGLCDFATCIPGKVKPCSDGKACTFSVCDPVVGCSHVNLPSETTCTNGQIADGRCYEGFKGAKALTWAEARGSCQAWGGVLATIRSKEGNAATRAQADAKCGKKADAWLGLNDRVREGWWRWGDGSSAIYLNWGKSEPNNAGNEDVASMRADGMWNDRSDDPKAGKMACWVCSRRLPQPCKAGGAACLAGATCAAGACDASAAKVDPCDDANACTADSCTKGTCQHAPLTKGATCTGGTCFSGVCKADPTPPVTIPKSCKTIYQTDTTASSGVRWLHPTALPAPVSAHCDHTAGGGWTLVLKTQGKNKDFAYAGKNWGEKPTKSVPNPGPEAGEALLPTYWSVPVQEIRVVMFRKKVRREVVMNAKGASLHALIQAKKPTPTTAGLAAWKQLIIDGSLQKSCHTEGINTGTPNGSGRVRIGIMGNQENNCASPDSWLGVGGIEKMCGGSKGVFSGNIACYGADKGNRWVAVPTWVYVR